MPFTTLTTNLACSVQNRYGPAHESVSVKLLGNVVLAVVSVLERQVEFVLGYEIKHFFLQIVFAVAHLWCLWKAVASGV